MPFLLMEGNAYYVGAKKKMLQMIIPDKLRKRSEAICNTSLLYGAPPKFCQLDLSSSPHLENKCVPAEYDMHLLDLELLF